MILNKEHYSLFVQAINGKKKIKMLKRNKDGNIIEKYYVPLDFGVMKKANDNNERYLNYNIKEKHPSRTLQEDVIEIIILDETFNPDEYKDIPWKSGWMLQRSR